MNINIAQNRPLIRQLRRIADALERMSQPPTVPDPASADDILFTDEASDYYEEERARRAKLHTELEDDVLDDRY